MVSKRDEKLVLYPRFFDAAKTRAEGRRVSSDLAKSEPHAGDIAEAAKTLGLNPVLEKDAAHPIAWWEKNGRVLVDKKWKKEETLKRIAKRL